MTSAWPPIAQLLLEQGSLSVKALKQVDRLLDSSTDSSEETAPVKNAMRLARLLASPSSAPWVDVRRLKVPQELLELVPLEFAESLRVLPVYLGKTNGRSTLYVATDDAENDEAIQLCEQVAHLRVRRVLTTPEGFERALCKAYGLPLPPHLLPPKPPPPPGSKAASPPAPPVEEVDPDDFELLPEDDPAPLSSDTIEVEPLTPGAKKVSRFPPLNGASDLARSRQGGERSVSDTTPGVSWANDDDTAPQAAIPNLLLIQPEEEWLTSCSQKVAKLPAAVEVVDLSSARRKVAMLRPFAVVIAEELYSFDRAGFQQMAISVAAPLLVWPEKGDLSELWEVIELAFRQAHPDLASSAAAGESKSLKSAPPAS